MVVGRCGCWTPSGVQQPQRPTTCFERLHAHHQELTTALTASGFTLERGGSSVVSRGLLSDTSRWLFLYEL